MIMHAAADPTNVILHPNPTNPLTKMGDKQTSALRHPVTIFDIATPPPYKIPTVTITRVEQT